jgi:hypothetical protein
VTETNEQAMAAMYHRVIRKPLEGTASAAIVVHAQACGFTAYAFNVHPDQVARAVAKESK